MIPTTPQKITDPEKKKELVMAPKKAPKKKNEIKYKIVIVNAESDEDDSDQITFGYSDLKNARKGAQSLTSRFKRSHQGLLMQITAAMAADDALIKTMEGIVDAMEKDDKHTVRVGEFEFKLETVVVV